MVCCVASAGTAANWAGAACYPAAAIAWHCSSLGWSSLLSCRCNSLALQLIGLEQLVILQVQQLGTAAHWAGAACYPTGVAAWHCSSLGWSSLLSYRCSSLVLQLLGLEQLVILQVQKLVTATTWGDSGFVSCMCSSLVLQLLGSLAASFPAGVAAW